MATPPPRMPVVAPRLLPFLVTGFLENFIYHWHPRRLYHTQAIPWYNHLSKSPQNKSLKNPTSIRRLLLLHAGECFALKYSTIGSCIFGSHLHVPRRPGGTAGGLTFQSWDEVIVWLTNGRTPPYKGQNIRRYIGSRRNQHLTSEIGNLEDELSF